MLATAILKQISTEMNIEVILQPLTHQTDAECSSGCDAARLKAISMEEVRGIVTDVNALQVLFIFDSCFSGTIFAARSPSASRGPLTKDDVARLVALPVREFITAGDMQERIPAHSPLPQLIVNALEGDADPYGLGVITGKQLQQYLFAETRSIGISPGEGKLPGGFSIEVNSFFELHGDLLCRLVRHQTTQPLTFFSRYNRRWRHDFNRVVSRSVRGRLRGFSFGFS